MQDLTLIVLIVAHRRDPHRLKPRARIDTASPRRQGPISSPVARKRRVKRRASERAAEQGSLRFGQLPFEVRLAFDEGLRVREVP